MSAENRHAHAHKSWVTNAKIGAPKRRVLILGIIFLVAAMVLSLRCAYVQGLDINNYAGQAIRSLVAEIPATRGTIYDRNGDVLAESQSAVNIIADPTAVSTNGMLETSMNQRDKLRAQAGPGILAGILVAYLGGDYETYYKKLSTTKTANGTDIRYTVLSQMVLSYVNLQITDQVTRLGYAGLYREQAPIRNYPSGTLASNVLGFMTYSDDLGAKGQYPWVGGGGLEYALDANLSGIPGEESYETSPYGRIPTGTSVVKEAQEGIAYTLTIDSGMQYMQDQAIAEGVKETGSRSGIAITMNVKTGEILALTNYPTFNSNSPTQSTAEDLGDRAVINAYEPGSVEKLVTMSALVDQGLVAPDTKVIVPAKLASGGGKIKDSFSHDTLQLTASGIIAQSSNIGITLLARQMGKSAYVSYLEAFGFGKQTGIGLPGEATGSIPNASMTDQTRDQTSFGQGMSVTAIQEAAAVAAIANGGVYNSPTIIASATDSEGNNIDVPETTTRRVISEEAAQQVLQMMESTVTSRPASHFDIPGYRTGVKSGTAEAIDPACGCYNGYVISFIGVAPVEDPQILTYVVFDHPSSYTTGSASAAPVYKDIMMVALERYGIPVSTTPAPDYQTTW